MPLRFSFSLNAPPRLLPRLLINPPQLLNDPPQLTHLNYPIIALIRISATACQLPAPLICYTLSLTFNTLNLLHSLINFRYR